MDQNGTRDRVYLEGIDRNHTMWITIILAVSLCLSVIFSVCQKRRTYRMIDSLLDNILSQERIVHTAYSDLEEGEYSALISKIMQIQEQTVFQLAKGNLFTALIDLTGTLIYGQGACDDLRCL